MSLSPPILYLQAVQCFIDRYCWQSIRILHTAKHAIDRGDRWSIARTCISYLLTVQKLMRYVCSSFWDVIYTSPKFVWWGGGRRCYTTWGRNWPKMAPTERCSTNGTLIILTRVRQQCILECVIALVLSAWDIDNSLGHVKPVLKWIYYSRD